MTDETVECFNCGRPNPSWAQVCRFCGVPMHHGEARTAPTGPFPTDRESLISIGAVVATIVAAVVLGLVLANLNPTDPTVGIGSPSPFAEATPEPTGTLAAPPPATPVPPTATPVPTPALPGTVAFGTGISGGQIQGQTDTFTPGMTFAHVITMTQPFGVGAVGEQVVAVADDGTETEVVSAADNQLNVDPTAMTAGVVCCQAEELIAELGPGNFVLRVYRDQELIAEGRFILAEG
jgi:hypothetical protein